jgi:hypothetical protein
MTTGAAVQRLISALEAGGYGPRANGAGWASRCPGHDDKAPSLSINVGDDGRVLLKDHAGCPAEHIVKALGLTMANLFPERRNISDKTRETRYRIADRNGNPVAVHVRRDGPNGKRFHWERGGRVGLGGLKVSDLPLYHAQSVASDEGIIVVTEGEKACDALRANGIAAVATTCGASSTPSAEVLSVLAGRDVVLWADNDEPGRQHMVRIAERLRPVAAAVRVFPEWHAPQHGDAADFLGAEGGTANDVRALLAHAINVGQMKETGPVEHGGQHQSVRLTRLADVEPKPVEWLWPGFVPLGMLTVADGDPGLGKSTMLLDIAARLTRGGLMPDGSPGPAASGVVILSAEDDLARVIRPRLDAARADVQRVVTLEVKRDGVLGPPTISVEDIPAIAFAVATVAAGLVVVDPLVAYLGADVNANRDQDVRRALVLLRDLAESTRAAVVVVRHLNKSVMHANPVYRGGGSIGIIGAARSGLVLALDPDDATGETRVLASSKMNLGPKPASLKLRLVVEAGASYPTVRWEGESQHTAATLLAQPEDPERRGEERLLDEWLRERLAVGPMPAAEAEQAGFDKWATMRARRRLGVGVARDAAGWWWRLGKTPPDPWPWELGGRLRGTSTTTAPATLQPLQPSLGDNGLEGCTDQRLQGSNVGEPTP